MSVLVFHVRSWLLSIDGRAERLLGLHQRKASERRLRKLGKPHIQQLPPRLYRGLHLPKPRLRKVRHR